MEDKTIGRLRNALIKKMSDLLLSADKTIHHLKNSSHKFADPVDQAALEESKNIELKFRSQEWKALLDIKETILRIDNGLYGICDHCGRKISKKRLRATPMSKLCIECQAQMESVQKNDLRKSRHAGRFLYHHAG